MRTGQLHGIWSTDAITVRACTGGGDEHEEDTMQIVIVAVKTYDTDTALALLVNLKTKR